MFDKETYWAHRHGSVLVTDKKGRRKELKAYTGPVRGQGLRAADLPVPPDSYIPQGPEFSKGISKKARRRARKVLHG